MRSRKVYQYDTEGNLKVIYPSLSLCDAEGYDKHVIGKYANNRSKLFGREYKGFIWKYEKDVINNDN